MKQISPRLQGIVLLDAFGIGPEDSDIPASERQDVCAEVERHQAVLTQNYRLRQPKRNNRPQLPVAKRGAQLIGRREYEVVIETKFFD